MRWETAAANGGRGTWIWQNFTSEHTQKANFDFFPGFSSALPPPRRRLQPLRLCIRSPPLYAKALHPQLFPFASDRICKLFYYYYYFHLLQFCLKQALVGPGVFPRSVLAGGCHTLLFAANPSEMSCPVRKIVKPSQSRAPCAARRFGVVGSWCLPGALGPNWDCTATPGEVPRLLSFPSTPSLSFFPLLSSALSASTLWASCLSFSPSAPVHNR